MEAIASRDEAALAAEPARPRRRRHWLRNVLIAIVVAIFAVWLVLFVTKGRFLRHPFERFAGSQTGRTVTIGGDFQLYFAPLAIQFLAERVTITNPQWASGPSLLTADKLDARIAPLSLLFGRRHFYTLDMTNGAVDLEWDKAHDRNTWTFGDPNVHGKPLQFPIVDRASVTGTTLRYIDPRMPLSANLRIDPITSTNARIGQAVGVEGDGRVRQTPFRVTARMLSPDATVNRGKNQLVLRAWAANNVIDVSGTLPGLADIENVPLQTRATGRNLAELLRIIGVAIPQTRRYWVDAQLVKDGDVYRFTQMRGRFGASDLAGRADGERRAAAAARRGDDHPSARHHRCRAVHRLRSRHRREQGRGRRRRRDRRGAAAVAARRQTPGRHAARVRRRAAPGKSAWYARATCRSRTSA